MKLVVLAFLGLPVGAVADTWVANVEALVAAVRDGAEGTLIQIAPGRYELEAPLEPKAGMTLKGSGKEATVITQRPDWQPSVATLPDPEVSTQGMDTMAYLIRLVDQAAGVTLCDLTLAGPQLHGAIFGWLNADLHVHDLRVEDFLWSGIRTFKMTGAKIHDCEFVDAGGKWKRGQPGTDGGISGGAIFATWMADSEVWNNRFTRTQEGRENGFFGIKGRQGRRCRIHHNTIGVNFSIEFPFEGDADMEIDHNVLHGVISIPKHGGGPVPESGRTFHIHHNWVTTSYAVEFVRNGVEIDHNLFDFKLEEDGGNLISGFGKAGAPGPALFHHNLVSNPGRGVIWLNEPYGGLEVRNNHILARTTVNQRDEGLFGFSGASDFSKYRIVDNVIECEGTPRPLLRRGVGVAALIENNRLIGVVDAADYENPKTGANVGLEVPLKFQCGVKGEVTVDGWEVSGATD